MKKLLVLSALALCLAACYHVKTNPGRVGQMYFTTIFFDVSGQDISVKSYKFLDEAAKVYRKNPDAQIEVRGYTDGTGSEAGNLKLSQERADKVSVALQERVITAAHISAVGYGIEKPIASNQTPEGRQQNRRVEIEFHYPEN